MINHILVMHVNSGFLPGNLDLSGAPFTLQVITTDHADGFPAAIDGVCYVFHNGFTWKASVSENAQKWYKSKTTNWSFVTSQR